jgi:dTDP-4-dehydrorhamnose reductase
MPEVVINTAGYNRVDDAEEHAKEAFDVNAVGVKNLSEAIRQIGAALVHISTDYVFDGEKRTPYVETDRPSPQSVYGISKLAGEYCIHYILQKYFIIRTTGLYGTAGCMGKGGGNFVDKIISQAEEQSEIRVVEDEILSPTYARDLAEKTYKLLLTEKYGLYHVVNRNCCSWHQFAKKVLEYLGKKVKITAIHSSDYKSRARRPHYSVLENAALAKLGMNDLRGWEEALRAYLVEKGYIK